MPLFNFRIHSKTKNDTRLPHIADNLTKQIHKTALGAETLVPFQHQDTPDIQSLKNQGYVIVGLEQDKRSVPLPKYKPPLKIVLVLGEEVEGIADELLNQCDDLIEIPMVGKKESYNVSVATGIALYSLTTSA